MENIINRKDKSKQAAIVTGASSGIGFAIAKRMAALGYEVFGFGRNFEKTGLETGQKAEVSNFHAVVCDILDTEKMCRHVKQIAAQYPVHVLVNNAGVGYYGLHEQLNTQKIKELVRTNLEAPMILTQQLMRGLKQHAGYVINIASVAASEANPHGCAYGATKAGLCSFSHSLFQEARKYGVKVVTIYPDMAKTELYRNADFMQGDEEASYLMPDEVADAVEYVLNQREGIAVTDIMLRPQLHRIKRKSALEK